jgi:hypothetical protein
MLAMCCLKQLVFRPTKNAVCTMSLICLTKPVIPLPLAFEDHSSDVEEIEEVVFNWDTLIFFLLSNASQPKNTNNKST